MSDHNEKKSHVRDMLAEIIYLSADPVVSVDSDHNIIWVNAAFEEMFGYKADEILGQSLNVLLPESLHSVHQHHINAYDNSTKKSRYLRSLGNLYGLTKSGKTVPLEISIQKHSKGRACYYTAICRDISNRLAREKHIQESEAKFSKLFNSSHHFTILMNGNGEALEFNDTAEQQLGIDARKYIGRKIWDCDFWAGEVDFTLVRDAVLRVKPDRDEMLIVNAIGVNNRKITVEITLKVIWMDYKYSMQIILEGNDITALVQSNKALMTSKGRLARAQKIARLGNWEWQVTSNEFFFSDEACRIFGLEPTKFASSYEAFIERTHSDDRDRVEKAILAALKGDDPYHVTHRIVLADGTEKIVEQWGEVRRTDDGNAVQMDGTIQDITQHWTREQELLVAKSQAEEANIAKAQFLSAISHELRTPLNAIIGFSTMIAEEHVGKINVPFYREYAVDINNSGKELLGLIQNILQMTNFELGSVKYQPCCLTAWSLLEAMMPVIATRAADKDIYIETSVSSDIPELYLDQAHTQRILGHLADNAIKFSTAGGVVKIDLYYRENEFVIDVIDHGIGLEDVDKEAIFDLFTQKDMTLSRIYGGVGLGLTIVKNLVEIQGGRVHVDSAVGQGSCFSVCFPNAEAKNNQVLDIGRMA